MLFKTIQDVMKNREKSRFLLCHNAQKGDVDFVQTANRQKMCKGGII